MTILKNTAILCLLFLVTFPSPGLAEPDIIKELTQSIAKAKTEDEKSRLYMFRARNYRNIGNMDMAEKDYDAALHYDHKGWIHLERGRFYMEMGDYLQAGKEAIAAQEETPTLQAESEKLMVIAVKKLEKEKQENTPPKEILLTQRWESRSGRVPQTHSSDNSSVRRAYAARNKTRAASAPRSVSRS
jgi:tetratricopeptide (TPR) repeat protein